jgi:hypothetical protein
MGSFRYKYEWISQLSDYPNRKTVTKSIKGTVGELQIISELTKRGYFVAKSVDPQCPFDVVVVDKNGKINLLDIKTNTYRKKGKVNWTKRSRKIYRTPTDKQKKLNIKLLMVDYES